MSKVNCRDIPAEFKGTKCSICQQGPNSPSFWRGRQFKGSRIKEDDQEEKIICFRCNEKERAKKLVEKKKADLKKADKVASVTVRRVVNNTSKDLRERNPGTPVAVVSSSTRSRSQCPTLEGRSMNVQFNLLSLMPEPIQMTEQSLGDLLSDRLCEQCTSGRVYLCGRMRGAVYLILTLQCNGCRRITFERVKISDSGSSLRFCPLTGTSLTPSVLAEVLLSFIGGQTFRSYSWLGTIPASTYKRYQKIVAQAIVSIIETDFIQLAQEVKSQNVQLWVASNGAWSHRGWRSKAHSYLIRIERSIVQDIDHPLPPILLLINLSKKHSWIRPNGKIVEIPGNFEGSSKAMENEALRRGISKLRSAGILPNIVNWAMDDDAGTKKILTDDPDCGHIISSSDAGHKKSNFLRSMKSVLGSKKRYATIAKRISTWYLSIIKRIEREIPDLKAHEDRVKKFQFYWKYTYTHYTQNCTDDVNCLCKHGSYDDLVLAELEGLLEKFEDVDFFESPNADPSTTMCASSSFDAVDSSSLASSASVLEESKTVSSSAAVDSSSQASSGLEESKTVRSERFWFDLTDPSDKEMWENLLPIFAMAENQVAECLYLINTIRCEGSNSRRLVYMRKDRFTISTGEARSSASALREVHGLAGLFSRTWREIGLEVEPCSEILHKLGKMDKEFAKDRTRKQSDCYKIAAAKLDRKNSQTKQEKESIISYKASNEKVLQVLPTNTTIEEISCNKCGGTDHSRSSHRSCKLYKPKTIQSTQSIQKEKSSSPSMISKVLPSPPLSPLQQLEVVSYPITSTNKRGRPPKNVKVEPPPISAPSSPHKRQFRPGVDSCPIAFTKKRSRPQDAIVVPQPPALSAPSSPDKRRRLRPRK